MGPFFYQTMGAWPVAIKYSLVLEKCLQPQKPRWAARGLGWGAFRMQCFSASINSSFFCAYAPHNKNTTCDRSRLIVRITSSVNASQPWFWWDPAKFERTVKVAFTKNTPWEAHPLRSPCAGKGIPRSVLSSLNILSKLGGKGTPAATEKASPLADSGEADGVIRWEKAD